MVSEIVAKIKSSDLQKLGAYDVVRVQEKSGSYVWQKDGLDKADIEYKENQSYILAFDYTLAEKNKTTNLTLRVDCELSTLKLFLKNLPHRVDGKYAYYYQNDIESRINELSKYKLDFVAMLENANKPDIEKRCKQELYDILKEQGLRVVRCSVINYTTKTFAKIVENKVAAPAQDLEQKLSDMRRAVGAEKRAEIESEALKIVLLNPAYTASGSGELHYDAWKHILAEAYSRGCDDFSKINQFVPEAEVEQILQEKTKQRIREAC